MGPSLEVLLRALSQDIQDMREQLESLVCASRLNTAEIVGKMDELGKQIEATNPIRLAEQVAAKLIEFAEQLPDEPEEENDAS